MTQIRVTFFFADRKKCCFGELICEKRYFHNFQYANNQLVEKREKCKFSKIDRNS
jgi:uncharacterized protein YkuJ